jgi:hypothetical protein
MFLLWTIHPSQ